MTEYQILTLCKLLGFDVVPLAMAAVMEADGNVEKEYEKRWKLKELPKGVKEPSEIKQGKLIDKPGFSMRIREEKKGSKATYTLTLKFYSKSDEAEMEISKEMFDKLWPEVLDEFKMEKTRYRLGRWEIDDIRTPAKMKGIVAEIELKSEKEKVNMPDEISCCLLDPDQKP
jgi:CYTH domain-containing protein